MKECRGLAQHGYDVHFYVADGRGDEVRDGITVHDMGKPAGRFARMLGKPWRIWSAACRNRESLVHFHDPELIPIALLLHYAGVRVIYDAHEDVPRQILSKYWITPWARKLVACSFELLENFAARRFDAVIGATPHIAARFHARGATAVDVRNYPLMNELAPDVERITGDPLAPTARRLAYVGGITAIRGLKEVVHALPGTGATLVIAGQFANASFEQELRSLPGWRQVDYRGQVDRAGVKAILETSDIGLVLFLPMPNHIDALPNKMFEYMSASVPVLASDFPLWRGIINEAQAGRCTDPQDVRAIAATINEMLADAQRLAEYGRSGRRAVDERYNWDREERKLLALYDRLLSGRPVTPLSNVERT